MLRIARNLWIVLATAVASIAIVYFSIPMSNTSQSSFDVIVVLGSPMRADGSISAVGRSRVLEASRQYRARVAPRLIMSGGPAHNRFVEAEGMARFAELQGVPASAIFSKANRSTPSRTHTTATTLCRSTAGSPR